jgi:hypothetical protein
MRIYVLLPPKLLTPGDKGGIVSRVQMDGIEIIIVKPRWKREHKQ